MKQNKTSENSVFKSSKRKESVPKTIDVFKKEKVLFCTLKT